MSIHSSLSTNLQVPVFFKKASGNLFEGRKVLVEDANKQDQTTSQNLKQTPFNKFRATSEITLDLPNQKARLTDKRNAPCEAIFKLHSANEISSPGKLKDFSDGVNTLIQKAREILLNYDIYLHIDLPKRHSRESYDLLRVLVSDVCLFPFEFCQKLKIRELTICKGETSENSPPQSQIGNYLFVDQLDGQKKILERLYKIIIDHIIQLRPNLIQEWEKIQSKDINNYFEDSMDSRARLEDTFMALMKNVNPAIRKPKVKALRKLLIRNFPDTISREWFENKRTERRSLRKVKFNFEEL